MDYKETGTRPSNFFQVFLMGRWNFEIFSFQFPSGCLIFPFNFLKVSIKFDQTCKVIFKVTKLQSKWNTKVLGETLTADFWHDIFNFDNMNEMPSNSATLNVDICPQKQIANLFWVKKRITVATRQSPPI